MSSVHTEPVAILQSAIADVRDAREYFNYAEGQEQIDEATIRLTAAETTVNRIIRDMKKQRRLKVSEYKCPFQSGALPSERIQGITSNAKY